MRSWFDLAVHPMSSTEPVSPIRSMTVCRIGTHDVVGAGVRVFAGDSMAGVNSTVAPEFGQQGVPVEPRDLKDAGVKDDQAFSRPGHDSEARNTVAPWVVSQVRTGAATPPGRSTNDGTETQAAGHGARGRFPARNRSGMFRRRAI